jgi:hypothetical protein
MATEEVYIILFAAVVLVCVFVGLLLLALQRLRRRKAQLISDLKNSPRLNADRAFNRLEMARREVGILGKQGSDVSRARELIAQSQSALDLRQFERSYELAQSAHESLVSSRQGRPVAPIPAAREPMSPRVPVTGAAPSMNPAPFSLTSPSNSGLPRNRMESQFEMRLLDSDLESAQRTRPSEPATLAALDFRAKARVAFDAGEYTDAFRFALKGRKGIGGHVEVVAPGPASRSGGTLAGGLDSAEGSLDLGASVERVASAARCPSCGYPTTPEDVFCRGCGTPRAPSACPRCGTPRTPADTFCGRCGERFS